MNKPLELNEGRDLINAVNKLNSLASQKILTKTSDAEKAGLDSYVRTALYEHASVLLACWFAVKTEYEPGLQAIAAIMRRSSLINAQMQQSQNEGNTSQPEPASNG